MHRHIAYPKTTMEEKNLVEAKQNPAVAVVQRKKRGKKRKISKHIAEAASTKEKSDPGDAAATTTAKTVGKVTANVVQKKRKTSTTAATIKNPAEAAAYLKSWQQSQQKSEGHANESTSWKFNKNTQSWLLRHLYEADKVSKGDFAVLLNYLKSGDKSTIQRCLEDATRRALRYQTSSADQPTKSGPTEVQDEAGATKTDKVGTGAASATGTAANPVAPGDTDEERWNKLDEHDKRKEYKRARKVLETLSS